jgi:hypothetical protein
MRDRRKWISELHFKDISSFIEKNGMYEILRFSQRYCWVVIYSWIWRCVILIAHAVQDARLASFYKFVTIDTDDDF